MKTNEVRPIDANTLKKSFEEDGHLSSYIEEFIDNAPTIDAEPVRHGRWVWLCYACGETEWACTSCANTVWLTSASRLKWCPNCGAKMDGEEDDENT